jgi:hypothetical protein
VFLHHEVPSVWQQRSDGDLANWTLDFGDGTSVSGDWSTGLPPEIVHEYTAAGISNCRGVDGNGVSGVCVITLTVTDSAGQSDSDVIKMAFVDLTPD